MSPEERNQKIHSTLEMLMEDYKGGRTIDEIKTFFHPDKEAVIEVLNKLQRIIFPGYFRNKTFRVYTVRNNVSMLLEDTVYNLIKQITIVLRYQLQNEGGDPDDPVILAKLEHKAEELTFRFLSTIPKIREYLDTDVQAEFDGDPAAFSKDEVIICYPGLYAIIVYRIAHELYELKIPLLPRIMSEYAHSITGIDINPGATIGKYFFIDHGTGIVIGETTLIGEHVKLYQGVTLGALSTRGGQRLKNVRRHPTLGDNVTIYSGASILGGDTVIGEGAVIGGNCFITTPVPAGARVSIKNQEMHVMITRPGEDRVDPEKGRLDADDTWFTPGKPDRDGKRT